MAQLLLIVAIALVVGAVVFGVAVLLTGADPGLGPAEPDGRAVPLPTYRPLAEGDIARTRFDTAVRGYRMAQVDQAMLRAAYDIGYKDELISVLEAEVGALREGRTEDADVLRRAREAALSGAGEQGSDETPPGEQAAHTDEPVLDLGDVSRVAVVPGQIEAERATTTAARPGPPPVAGDETDPQPDEDDTDADRDVDADGDRDTDADADRDVDGDGDGGGDPDGDGTAADGDGPTGGSTVDNTMSGRR